MTTLHITDKLEKALVFVCQQAVATIQDAPLVYAGKDWADKRPPCVICAASGDGQEEPLYTGNFWLEARVIIQHLANDMQEDGVTDGRAKMQLVSDYIWQALTANNIATVLCEAADNFFVYETGILVNAPTTTQNSDDMWSDEISMRVYCKSLNSVP